MSEELQLAFSVAVTEAEGPGRRFAVWVQGCTLGCPGCCNPEMWSAGGGETASVSSLLDQIGGVRDRIEGLSFLGGEPFEQEAGCAALARGARAMGLTVMVFTGLSWRELTARPRDLLDATDLLVAGRYVERLRTTKRRWIGSDNQTLHFLTDAYHPEDPRFAEPNHSEIRYTSDGEIVVVGFPFDSVMKAFPKTEDGPRPV